MTQLARHAVKSLGRTQLEHLPYELLVTILQSALIQDKPSPCHNAAAVRSPVGSSCSSPFQANPSVAASLRLVCHTWLDACDQLTTYLRVRSWPCPFNMARRFKATQHVHLHQLRINPTAADDIATSSSPTLPPPKRHTRSCGPPPLVTPSHTCKQVAAAQAMLHAMAQLPHLRSVTVEQAWAGAVRGKPAQTLVASVVAGLHKLPGLTDVHLIGDGIGTASPHVVTAMTAPAISITAADQLPASHGKLRCLVVHGTRLRQLPMPPHALALLHELQAPGLVPITTMFRNRDYVHMSQLQILDLKQCRLTALPSDMGQQLPQLTYLDLSGNALPALPPSMGQLMQLQHLDVSDNKLASLPDSFTSLTSLNHLNLSTNWQLGSTSLYNLPTLLPHLHYCDLSATGLTSLPTRFQWPGLNTLMLSCNELEEVPIALLTCRSLQSLSMDHNNLNQLPDWLHGACPSLTSLDMSSNQLTALPDAIGTLSSSLQTLHLASNELTTLPSSFHKLSSLTDLDLQDNKLGPTLPCMLWACGQLEVLNVAGNGIASLPAQIEGLRQLRWLDVSYNKLSSLPWLDSTTPTNSSSSHTRCIAHPSQHASSCVALPNLEVLKLRGNCADDSTFSVWACLTRVCAPRLTLCDLEDDMEEGAAGQEGAAAHDNRLHMGSTAGVMAIAGQREDVHILIPAETP